MPTTIASLASDANALFTALMAGAPDFNLDLVPVVVDTDFPTPVDPAFPAVTPLTLDQLTTKVVDGSGVFDGLMTALNAHLKLQFDEGRITGADYAKVYLGGVTAVMQFGVQYLLGKDRAVIENLQLIEAAKLTQAQVVKAQAEIQLTKLEIQNAQYRNAEIRLKAYIAKNQYAGSKMDLVLGYNGVLKAENEQKLVDANYLAVWAQTHTNLPDGAAVGGILGTEKDLKLAQKSLVSEQVELAHAQVSDTKTTGGAYGGLVAVEKQTKEAQRLLTNEQVDTARASTKDTLQAGGAIAGIAAKEKALKDAQGKLVLEQFETQRGQTRGTLSTGEAVGGLVGAQTQLYQQQITSYKRDAESKGVKMLLDTWVARKTIDEGVAVPAVIDGAALNTRVTNYLANLAV